VSGRLGEITRTITVARSAGNGTAFCWLRLKTTVLMLCWLVALLIAIFIPTSPAAIFAGLSIGGIAAIYIKKRSDRQTLLFIPNKLLCLVDVLAGLPKLLSVRHLLVAKPQRKTAWFKSD
jgi:hypothetical protein